MADAVGIVCHPRIDIGGAPVMEARRRLEKGGFRVWTYCATAEERPGALEGELNGTRLIVSIGGDGTLLWTAQQAAAARIPVLGINAGRLGFLTQVQLGEEGQALDRWAAGDFTLQRRALLEAHVDDRAFLALNDVTVHKGIEINLIRIEAFVDGHPAGRFDADGIIVSTPTGSAILTCDGQQTYGLRPGAEVRVAAPGLQVELVQFSGGRNFFELLRRKLRWGLPLTDGDE